MTKGEDQSDSDNLGDEYYTSESSDENNTVRIDVPFLPVDSDDDEEDAADEVEDEVADEDEDEVNVQQKLIWNPPVPPPKTVLDYIELDLDMSPPPARKPPRFRPRAPKRPIKKSKTDTITGVSKDFVPAKVIPKSVEDKKGKGKANDAPGKGKANDAPESFSD